MGVVFFRMATARGHKNPTKDTSKPTSIFDDVEDG